MQDNGELIPYVETLKDDVTMWKFALEDESSDREWHYKRRVILELRVPVGARMRWSVHKCRCDKAYVANRHYDGDLDLSYAYRWKSKKPGTNFHRIESHYTRANHIKPRFLYPFDDKTLVEPSRKFDDDPDSECTVGIHCFRTKEEAIDYAKSC
jgi:hypothetical protein